METKLAQARSFIASVRQVIHQAYHTGALETCTKGTCADAIRILEATAEEDPQYLGSVTIAGAMLPRTALISTDFDKVKRHVRDLLVGWGVREDAKALAELDDLKESGAFLGWAFDLPQPATQLVFTRLTP